MHGLGNDFVILDARGRDVQINEKQIIRIADRHFGVGCDQIVILRPANTDGAEVLLDMYNSDGSSLRACGNATRCVARQLMQETGRDVALIETVSGILTAQRHAEGVRIDMGPAYLDWKDIPLSQPADTLLLDTGIDDLPAAVAVSMGNPHVVFFVEDAEEIDLAGLGPRLEHHPLFPQRANVEFAQIISPGMIRMRVWERGTGITKACGSGACAVLVAAVRRGLCAHRADVLLDGGVLQVEWLDNGHVIMTGPASFSFSGELSDELLAS
jgi:diaminopimelate epimerase